MNILPVEKKIKSFFFGDMDIDPSLYNVYAIYAIEGGGGMGIDRVGGIHIILCRRRRRASKNQVTRYKSRFTRRVRC